MVYYICHYTCSEIEKEQRACAPAARCKASYIIDKLSDISDVEVISPSVTNAYRVVSGSKTKMSNGSTLKTFTSFNSSISLIRFIGRILTNILLILYLIKNLKRSDKVLVYHSLALIKIISLLKRLIGFELTIEIEEIYSNVTNNKRCRAKEMKFFEIADKYIMITGLLNEKINIKNKPVAITHGAYSLPNMFDKLWNDEKMHIVYAGTFNPTKGGVFAAIKAAEYLNEKYHMHILGFGSEENVKNVKSEIKRVSSITKAEISYHGQLKGNEYISFLQSCDIGLSTQNPSGKFNNTSFPSKILSYMSNGLRVVSIRIPAIETSYVGKYMYYYDEQNPEKIAKAIMEVDVLDDYDGREIVKELDEQFSKDLKELF